MENRRPTIFNEEPLYQFECALDLLDKLSDSFIEDRQTTNAINAIHALLSEIYMNIGDV